MCISKCVDRDSESCDTSMQMCAREMRDKSRGQKGGRKVGGKGDGGGAREGGSIACESWAKLLFVCINHICVCIVTEVACMCI